MKRYRIQQDYHALTCNCTTISLDGMKKAIPKFEDKSSKYNDGRGLGISEKLAAKASGWPSHLFMPKDLEAYMKSSDFSALMKSVGKTSPKVNVYKK